MLYANADLFTQEFRGILGELTVKTISKQPCDYGASQPETIADESNKDIAPRNVLKGQVSGKACNVGTNSMQGHSLGV